MKERKQDLPPVFERPVHAVDFEFVIIIVDLHLPVAAAASEQVPGQDVSGAAFPLGAVGNSDGAHPFRFWPHDGQAALYRYRTRGLGRCPSFGSY